MRSAIIVFFSAIFLMFGSKVELPQLSGASGSPRTQLVGGVNCQYTHADPIPCNSRPGVPQSACSDVSYNFYNTFTVPTSVNSKVPEENISCWPEDMECMPFEGGLDKDEEECTPVPPTPENP